MLELLLWLGRLAGLGGAFTCALALGARLSGSYWVAGLQVGTLLHAGSAAMIFAALCFLAWLVERERSRQEKR